MTNEQILEGRAHRPSATRDHTTLELNQKLKELSERYGTSTPALTHSRASDENLNTQIELPYDALRTRTPGELLNQFTPEHTKTLARHRKRWQDVLDDPQHYPPSPEQRIPLRRAYSSYRIYVRFMERVEKAVEDELQTLEKQLLRRPEKYSAYERARGLYRLAEAVELPAVARRIKSLLQAIELCENPEPVPSRVEYQIDQLHQEFKQLIHKIRQVEGHAYEQAWCRYYSSGMRSLRERYFTLGCEEWKRQCEKIITLLDRKGERDGLTARIPCFRPIEKILSLWRKLRRR